MQIVGYDIDGHRYTLEPDCPVDGVTALMVWDDAAAAGHIITVNRQLIARILELFGGGNPSIDEVLAVMESYGK